jgi:hypothetical protein
MELVQKSIDGGNSSSDRRRGLHRKKSSSSSGSGYSNSISNSICTRLAGNIKRHTDSLELFVHREHGSSVKILLANDISNITSIATSLRDINGDGDDESVDILQEEGVCLNNNTHNNMSLHRQNDGRGDKESNSTSNSSIICTRLAGNIKRHTDSLELFVQRKHDSRLKILLADDISNIASISTSLRDIGGDGDDESIDMLQGEGVCLDNTTNNNNADLDDYMNEIGEESFNHHHDQDSDDLVEELQRFVAAEEAIFSAADCSDFATGSNDLLTHAVVNKEYIESDDETQSTADLTESSSSSSSFSSLPDQENDKDERDDDDDDDNMLNYKYHVRKLASTHRRPGIFYPPSLLPRSRHFDEYLRVDHKHHNTTDDSGSVHGGDSSVGEDSQDSLVLVSKGTASKVTGSTSSLDEDSSIEGDDNESASHILILADNSSANTSRIQVPPERMRRHIRFSIVEIREFAVTVGDHPHARDSCPITLDWPHAAPYSLTLDEYENKRFFARKSCCSTSRKNLKRLSLEQRRQRVRETSRMALLALREMELAVAMNRLQQSMDGINDFWRKIDENNNNNNNHAAEKHPKRQEQEQQQQVRQEQTHKIRKSGGGKKASSKGGTLQQDLTSLSQKGATIKATSTTTPATNPSRGTKKRNKNSSKQSSSQASISSPKSKQSKRHERVPKSTSNSINKSSSSSSGSSRSSKGGSSSSCCSSSNNNNNRESPYVEAIIWRRVNRAVI